MVLAIGSEAKKRGWGWVGEEAQGSEPRQRGKAEAAGVAGSFCFSPQLKEEGRRKKKKDVSLELRYKCVLTIQSNSRCAGPPGGQLLCPEESLLLCPQGLAHGGLALFGGGLRFLPGADNRLLGGGAAAGGLLDSSPGGCWLGFLGRSFDHGWRRPGLPTVGHGGLVGLGLGFGLSPFHRRGPVPCFRWGPLLHPATGAKDLSPGVATLWRGFASEPHIFTHVF